MRVLNILLNIAIIIGLVVLGYLVIYPQYAERMERSKKYDVWVNMHILQGAVEKYAAYHEGIYPTTLDTIIKYMEEEPINPYTGKSLIDRIVRYPGDTLGVGEYYVVHDTVVEGDSFVVVEDTLGPGDVVPAGDTVVFYGIKVFEYESYDEPKGKTGDSKNATLRGPMGTLAYGYYDPSKKRLPISYGILGFDRKGMPLHEVKPNGEIELYVLYPEEE